MTAAEMEIAWAEYASVCQVGREKHATHQRESPCVSAYQMTKKVLLMMNGVEWRALDNPRVWFMMRIWKVWIQNGLDDHLGVISFRNIGMLSSFLYFQFFNF